ncbi:Proteasome subunit beta type-4-like protein [Dinothrombium tinctorium]|uniref:Proteasome subunit beta n=1 Tax=Dinothrombium tinctorium TaxID=1965070 RepID=A0A3S3NX44_9ACAR|nr:Proteasome subunit beta type-4-like protein [Dinothrombium tinctorium]RWS07727.1 Proteasome subunit beta type-4-like protein [Dinothrombium tinctorium]RWS07804.1 Proteasome subunit beta type-4-like protein [Dinothrombium tinctorium]
MKYHTQSPASTGTSVIGITFNDGVLIASDDLVSYGTLARYRNIPRVLKVNEQTVVGCGGDFADFQHLSKIIEQKQIDEEANNDGFTLTPKALHSWITRVLYNRRSKFDPFWNTWVVGGLQDGKPFLGYVDMLGTAFVDRAVATGYGEMIAKPLLWEAVEKKESITEEEAKDLIAKCMSLLFCRDSRAFPKYRIAKVTKDGSVIEGPFEVNVDWSIAAHVQGYE